MPVSVDNMFVTIDMLLDKEVGAGASVRVAARAREAEEEEEEEEKKIHQNGRHQMLLTPS